MKIKKICFENFKTFKNRCEVEFSTDGRVTIIYGRNGDGKTTLHQLFQWILYGKTNFNKTNKQDCYYNLEFADETPLDRSFDVRGTLDFENQGTNYSLTRKETYYKESQDVIRKKESQLILQYMDERHNWIPLDPPQEYIESFLPSGLSNYFFFDGESMIADLNMRSGESAQKLKKTFYSIFDLNILEKAISHIGKIDTKTSLLGKLQLSKGTGSEDRDILNVKQEIEKLNQLYQIASDDLEKLITEQKKCENKRIEISEKIGSQKTKETYNTERNALKLASEKCLQNQLRNFSDFGEKLFNEFTYMLIAKAASLAQEKLKLEIGKNKLPNALTKELINYLINSDITECICGRPMSEEHKEHIKNFLKLLPPNSYTMVYNQFTAVVKKYANIDIDEFRARLAKEIKEACDKEREVEDIEMKIRELDEIEKNSPDIGALVSERQRLEGKLRETEEQIKIRNTNKSDLGRCRDFQNGKLDKLTVQLESTQKINYEIKIMKEVLSRLNYELNAKTEKYCKELEKEIQYLMDKMLTGKRYVNVDDKFSLKVADEFGDESKSEGQFAIASFAYIGGVLRVLKNEDQLREKEFPLVLDGPFSKLDPIHIKNVVMNIPYLAPQVIIFSKDDLTNIFDEDKVGDVWTIQSNVSKTVATVRKGLLW